jgi:hypothetical protein
VHIEEALTTYLLAQPALTALISGRFYFDIRDEGDPLPAVVCRLVSNVPSHTHQGQSTLESPSYQFTAYGPTRAQARSVAVQLKAALCDYSGTMSGLNVAYVELQNELANTEMGPDGTTKIHTIDLEFQINYEKE